MICCATIIYYIGSLPQIICGFAVSFISALVVIRALLAFVSRYNFTPFGYYRIVFGALVLLAL